MFLNRIKRKHSNSENCKKEKGVSGKRAQHSEKRIQGKKRKKPETDSSSVDSELSSSESEIDYYSDSDTCFRISEFDSSELSSSTLKELKHKKIKSKKKVGKKRKQKASESDSDTTDVESSSSSSGKKKKLKKKKSKTKTEPPVKKSKAVGKSVPKDLPLPAKSAGMKADDLDINKIRTVTGSGRVSVPCDQWIQLMEFVQ